MQHMLPPQIPKIVVIEGLPETSNKTAEFKRLNCGVVRNGNYFGFYMRQVFKLIHWYRPLIGWCSKKATFWLAKTSSWKVLIWKPFWAFPVTLNTWTTFPMALMSDCPYLTLIPMILLERIWLLFRHQHVILGKIKDMTWVQVLFLIIIDNFY